MAMAALASPMLKIGQGFGTWLIPIIIFGILGSLSVLSLAGLVCAYSCLPRRERMDQEPELTHEIYRTPTTPYRDPSSDRPVDATIGRLITHSRSLHVPRNQTVSPHRLRPQLSSPELRYTSQPPPYTYRRAPTSTPYRNQRPHGQVYFNHITHPGRTYPIPRQPQQQPLPPENVSIQPERCFSASSPSSYSSSCTSIGGSVFAEVFFPPSTPSISSQESLAPVQTLHCVNLTEPRDSDTDYDVRVALSTPPNHKELTDLSNLPDPYGAEKLPTPRPVGDLNGRFGRANRRLIIVDNNLIGMDSQIPSDHPEARALGQAEVTRPVVRSTSEWRTAERTAAVVRVDEEETRVQAVKPSQVGHDEARGAVLKVICPDTGDLWKMPVIPGETLAGFAGRVKQRTGGDVMLFVDDEILASEEDWKAMRAGGRIVAHLIR
ncbi:hypothetical protein BJ322DRAFT_497475 [Thelephora terrestris]|uniref:Uncharacterized protein n=1 Tax=Thelephora terrestris TaxID=56493 RepID=A0A9P6H678_9AGAM|nr:hypothetical protein BJ322DRAFT_497475 [Thelephora terrestris]